MQLVAMYFESPKWANGWAGYFYPIATDKKLTYLKDGTDQDGKPVKVYTVDDEFGLESPGGMDKTNMIIRLEEN